jgi:hypothetical protein
MWEPVEVQKDLYSAPERLVHQTLPLAAGKTESILMYPFYSGLEGHGLAVLNGPYIMVKHALDRLAKQGLTISTPSNSARSNIFTLYVVAKYEPEIHSTLRVDYIGVDNCQWMTEADLARLSLRLTHDGTMKMISGLYFFNHTRFI